MGDKVQAARHRQQIPALRSNNGLALSAAEAVIVMQSLFMLDKVATRNTKQTKIMKLASIRVHGRVLCSPIARFF